MREAPAWAQHSRTVEAWVRNGYRMRWEDSPPPPFWRRAYPTDALQRAELQKERDKNLVSGSWVACETQDGHALVRKGCCISPAFCIPKKDDPDPRCCSDMRIVNEYARKVSARPQGLNLVPTLCQRNGCAMSCDVKKAFHQVGIHRDDWRYMVLDLGQPEGEISMANPQFVYMVILPFGYTNSPAVWQKTMLCVLTAARKRVVLQPGNRRLGAKSMRKTMASGPAAQGVPDTTIQHWGLWGRSSLTHVLHYIDRTYPPDPFVGSLFDFLLP
eukprot:SAG31_NODE_8538_length_1433_cov_18.502249_2_plen_271_part_01